MSLLLQSFLLNAVIQTVHTLSIRFYAMEKMSTSKKKKEKKRILLISAWRGGGENLPIFEFQILAAM